MPHMVLCLICLCFDKLDDGAGGSGIPGARLLIDVDDGDGMM